MEQAEVPIASPVATLSSTFRTMVNEVEPSWELSVAVYPELIEGSLTCMFKTLRSNKIVQQKLTS